MIVNALLYGAAILGLTRLPKYPSTAAVLRAHCKSFREGFSYIRAEPRLRSLFIALLVFLVFSNCFVQLLPARSAHDTLHVGAKELSYLVSAAGLGALLGGGDRHFDGCVAATGSDADRHRHAHRRAAHRLRTPARARPGGDRVPRAARHGLDGLQRQHRESHAG